MTFDNRKTERATDILAAFQEAEAQHARTMARHGAHDNKNAPKTAFDAGTEPPTDTPPAPPSATNRKVHNTTEKLMLKKYDPVKRKHVTFTLGKPGRS